MSGSAGRPEVKLCKRGHLRTPENVATDRGCKACGRERQRKRYKEDSEYRERELERKRERYQEDPEYRERKLERNLERYYSDDPKIHFSILQAQVKADLKRRQQRIDKRKELGGSL